MDPRWDDICDFCDNLDHIKRYMPENPKLLCIGNEKGLCCQYLNDWRHEDFKDSSLVILPDEQVNYLDPKFYQPFFNENGQFNLVFLSCLNEENILDLIANIFYVKQIVPEVVIIDCYKHKIVSESIFDNSILLQKEYVLEVVNTQYILVRRDCYSKVCSS